VILQSHPSRTRPKLSELVAKYKFVEAVYIAQPRLPEFDDYTILLRDIWDSKILTNRGKFHHAFEQGLNAYLGIEYSNIFCNGTLALMIALQAMRLNGEVITTPFTFAATAHVLHWNGLKPVFCDIDEKTFNLDPAKIEGLITPETVAILPVHVFGNPCDVDALKQIGDRHGLRIIYDAAHAFGVKVLGKSIAGYGDISMLSFHATKLFTTFEGGALVSHDQHLKKRIDFLTNFGIADEETIIGPGINAKMSEPQAIMGILGLKTIEDEIEKRKFLTNTYRKGLSGIDGLRLLEDIPGVRHNYAYFPILVDEFEFGISRDELYVVLKQFNLMVRKYFYPLCSQYSCYNALPSARPENLPVAERVAAQVLCLPLYGDLKNAEVKMICQLLTELHYLYDKASI